MNEHSFIYGEKMIEKKSKINEGCKQIAYNLLKKNSNSYNKFILYNARENYFLGGLL